MKTKLHYKSIHTENGQQVLIKKSTILLWFLLFTIIALIMMQFTNFRVDILMRRGLNFFTILSQMYPPDFSFLPRIISPIIESIQIAFFGTILGSGLALIISLTYPTQLQSNKVVTMLIRFILLIIRSIPVLVMALIFRIVFGPGMFPGLLAISVVTFSRITKIMGERIESFNFQPFNYLFSTGSTKAKAIVLAILPQIIVPLISQALLSFEINFRSSTIIGLVGAGGIGLILNEQLNTRNYDKVGLILLVSFIIIITLQAFTTYIQRKMYEYK